MTLDDLNLSTRTHNTLLRAGIKIVEQLQSRIEHGSLVKIPSLGSEGVNEIMESAYCTNCKRSIYGEYKDCDINIENNGKYTRGNSKCGCTREIFQKALLANAVSIIVFHNHPSGDPTPSREDVQVTKRLVEAGNVVGVQVLDHIVIGRPGYVSLKEKGYL